MIDHAEAPPRVICVGSALWDVIGRTEREMPNGADRPGRIQRSLGGVALNAALALATMGTKPVLLTHIGEDAEGATLVEAAEAHGVDTAFVTPSKALPTDSYMAIEGPDGLVAAIADTHALEAVGDALLSPLMDGRLGSTDAPFEGVIVIDGNLASHVLEQIAASPAFARADLRLAPASPGKADRLAPLLSHPRATFYLNKEEAGLLAGVDPFDSREAAEAVLRRGARRVLVTDGPRAACAMGSDEVFVDLPPPTSVFRVTGAGDMFMAAHIAAILRGSSQADALRAALVEAAAFVSGAQSR